MIEFFDVEGSFPRPVEPSPAQKTRELALDATFPAPPPPTGASVAIAVGSRGIKGIAAIVKSVANTLSDRGFSPFIVPAMGSHGGDTPQGQEKTLAALGITRETVGAPVVSEGGLVMAGKTPGGTPVWVDERAFGAAAIIPINRIKPHTAFRGAVESGPSKLMTVGLGKAKSAAELHRAGLATAIPAAMKVLLETGKVPFGIAILENAFAETAKISLLAACDWLSQEAALLREAWVLYPRLPWDNLDILIVEKIGKDISGTGMDINIIGMERRYPGCGAFPVIGQVIALGLSEKSGGNATGIGYADITTKELVQSADWEATRLNCEASGFTEAARVPVTAEDEAEAISIALENLGKKPGEVLAVKITDTSSLTKIKVSRTLLDHLPPHFHRL